MHGGNPFDLKSDDACIEHGRTDDIMWESAAKADSLRELSKSMKESSSFDPLLQDLFQSYYKIEPKDRPLSDLSRKGMINRPFVDQIREDRDMESIRQGTVLNDTAAAVATVMAGQVLAKAIKDAPKGQQPNQNAMNKATRQAQRAAAQGAQDAQDTMAGWGLTGSEFQTMPLGERMNLVMAMMTPRFKKMAELIGRMRGLARSAQTGSLHHARDEIHGITFGDDLSRVLPQELVGIKKHKMLRLLFQKKFLEKQLMQYQLRPVTREKRGPIICMIDKSGSMSGDPMDWAVAVGLALADIARRQKRAFAACFFDTELVRTYHAENGALNPKDLIEFSTVAAGGGTDYQPALEWAVQVQNQHDFRGADLAMITDGYCMLPGPFVKQFLDVKAARGLRTFTILIGTQEDDEYSRALRVWSDQVWASLDLADEHAVSMFNQITPGSPPPPSKTMCGHPTVQSMGGIPSAVASFNGYTGGGAVATGTMDPGQAEQLLGGIENGFDEDGEGE